MRTFWNKRTAVAAVCSVVMLFHGTRADAFTDDLILANLLVNAVEQLAAAQEALRELRKSYAEVKRVAEYADDAAEAARSFRQISARRFGDSFLADLDAAYPDLDRYRSEAHAELGLGASAWARGTSTLRSLSRYCLPDAGDGGRSCVQLRGRLESAGVLKALGATFSGGGGALETAAVDAEVAATIRADAAQGRVAELQKARLRELLRRCNGDGALDPRGAKKMSEECRLAAEQAQVLQLEAGQETNLKLAQLARLQAISVEQENAARKREIAEQEARRAALTDGLEDLSRRRVSIRSGGLAE
jgi:hypothetical protein